MKSRSVERQLHAARPPAGELANKGVASGDKGITLFSPSSPSSPSLSQLSEYSEFSEYSERRRDEAARRAATMITTWQ